MRPKCLACPTTLNGHVWRLHKTEEPNTMQRQRRKSIMIPSNTKKLAAILASAIMMIAAALSICYMAQDPVSKAAQPSEPAFAIYAQDGGEASLSFYRGSDVPDTGDAYDGILVSEVYTDFEQGSLPPWSSHAAEITSVNFQSDENFSLTPTSTAHWFEGMDRIDSIDMTKIDMSMVESTTCMFRGCSSLGYLGIASSNLIEVPRLRDASSMFEGCSTLDAPSIDFSTSSCLENLSAVFAGCADLNNLTLSAMFENVNTTDVIDLSRAFSGCTSLTDLSLVEGMDVSSVSDMSGIFEGCKISFLDLSEWTTSSAMDMSAAFKDFGPDDGTSSVIFGDRWDTRGVTNMSEMFAGSRFEVLDLSAFDTAAALSSTDMFEGARSLVTVYISGRWTSLDDLAEDAPSLMGGLGSTIQKCGPLPLSVDREKAAGLLTPRVDIVYKAHRSDSERDSITEPIPYEYGMTPIAADVEGRGRCDTWVDQHGNVFGPGDVIEYDSDLSKAFNDIVLTPYSESFAVYDEDNETLVFYRRPDMPKVGDEIEYEDSFGQSHSQTVSQVWVGMETDEYSCRIGEEGYVNELGMEDVRHVVITDCPWHSIAADVRSVVVDATDDNVIAPASIQGWFAGMSSAAEIDLSHLSISHITDLSDAFYGCASLPSIVGIETFDASRVTDASHAFYGCSSLVSLSLPWTTYALEDMSYMLAGCSNLSYIWAGDEFETDSVEDMSHLLDGCKRLSIPSFVEDLDMKGVRQASYMLSGCSSIKSLDLSSWDLGRLESANGMFSGCAALVTITVSDELDGAGLISSSNVFYGCSKIIGGLGTAFRSSDTSGELARVDGQGGLPGYFTPSIKVIFHREAYDPDMKPIERAYVYGRVVGIEMNAGYTGWITSEPDAEPTAADRLFAVDEIVTYDPESPFQDVGLWPTLTEGSAFAVYSADDESLRFYRRVHAPSPGEEIAGRTVTDVYGDIESKEYSASYVPEWLDHASTIEKVVFEDYICPISCAKWFSDMGRVESMDVSKLVMTNVKDVSYMFAGCFSPAFPGILDLSMWAEEPHHGIFEANELTDASHMFEGSNITSVRWPRETVADSLRDISYMFAGATRLDSIDFEGFMTSNIRYASHMFEGCALLHTAKIGDILYSRDAIDCTSIFEGCTDLVSVNWSGADFAKTDGLSRAFYECASLVDPGFSMIDLQATDMSYAFYGCTSLTEFPEIGSMRYVTDLSHAFEGCTSLASLDWHPDAAAALTSAEGMFCGCTSLGDACVSLVAANLTSTSSMFAKCTRLSSAKLEGWRTPKLADMDSMFAECTSLASFSGFGEDDSTWGSLDELTSLSHMFAGCSSLEEMDLYQLPTSSVRNISGMFEGCNVLSRIIIGRAWVTGSIESSEAFLPHSFSTTDERYVAGVDEVLPAIDNAWERRREYVCHAEAFAVYFADSRKLCFYKDSDVPATGEQYRGLEASSVYEGIENVAFEFESDAEDGTSIVSSEVPWHELYDEQTRSVPIDSVEFVLDPDERRIKPKSMAGWFLGVGRGSASTATIDFSSIDTSDVESMASLFAGCTTDSIDLTRFDTSKVTDMRAMFSGCDKLTYVSWPDSRQFDTREVEDFSCMFKGCKRYSPGYGFSPYGTSKVRSTREMFAGSAITSFASESWDLSHVEDLSRMFYGCEMLSDVRFREGSWAPEGIAQSASLASATDMHEMVAECPSLTDLDLKVSAASMGSVADLSGLCRGDAALSQIRGIEDFDVSSVENFSEMLSGCESFEPYNLNLSKWRTPSAKDMSSMFRGVPAPGALDLSGFDTSQVTDMSYMFAGYGQEGWGDSNKIILGSKTAAGTSTFSVALVEDITSMFEGVHLAQLDLSFFDTSSVKAADNVFAGSDLELVFVSEMWGTDKGEGFAASTKATPSLVGGKGSQETGNEHLPLAVDTVDRPGLLTPAINVIFKESADAEENLIDPQRYYPPSAWFASLRVPADCNGQACEYWVNQFGNIIQTGTEITYDDERPFEDLIYTPAQMRSFAALDADGTLLIGKGYHIPSEGAETIVYVDGTDIGQRTFEHVWEDIEDEEYIRYGDGASNAPWQQDGLAGAIREVLTGANVDDDPSLRMPVAPTSIAGWFEGLSSCDRMDLTYLDTSKVTDLSHAFAGCESLVEFEGAYKLDFSNVANMSCMFEGCSALDGLSCRWDTSNVTDMSHMFEGCTSLSSIYFGSNTGSVTTFESMFEGCESLDSLPCSTWDLASAKTLSSMFKDCVFLADVYFSRVMESSSLEDMSHMFEGCTSLESANVKKLDTSSVKDMSHLFDGCSAMEALDMRGMDTSHVEDMSYMLNDCTTLTDFAQALATPSVRKFDSMFRGVAVDTLDLSTYDASNVESTDGMLADMPNLSVLYLGPGWYADKMEATGLGAPDPGEFEDADGGWHLDTNVRAHAVVSRDAREIGEYIDWAERNGKAGTTRWIPSVPVLHGYLAPGEDDEINVTFSEGTEMLCEKGGKLTLYFDEQVASSDSFRLAGENPMEIDLASHKIVGTSHSSSLGIIEAYDGCDLTITDSVGASAVTETTHEVDLDVADMPRGSFDRESGILIYYTVDASDAQEMTAKAEGSAIVSATEHIVDLSACGAVVATAGAGEHDATCAIAATDGAALSIDGIWVTSDGTAIDLDCEATLAMDGGYIVGCVTNAQIDSVGISANGAGTTVKLDGVTIAANGYDGADEHGAAIERLGALRVSAGAHLDMSGCTVASNFQADDSVMYSVAGICIDGFGEGESFSSSCIKDSIISCNANQAPSYGNGGGEIRECAGGIAILGNATRASLDEGVAITTNYSAGTAAGAYLDADDVRIGSCTFAGNVAAGKRSEGYALDDEAAGSAMLIAGGKATIGRSALLSPLSVGRAFSESTGALITANHCERGFGAVAVAPAADVTLSGDVTISGNADARGAASNLYLAEDAIVSVLADLDPNAIIGIKTFVDPSEDEGGILRIPFAEFCRMDEDGTHVTLPPEEAEGAMEQMADRFAPDAGDHIFLASDPSSARYSLSATDPSEERPDEPGDEKVPVEDMGFDKTEITLKVGESEKLHVTIIPEDADQEVIWSTSDESVVVVDDDGNVTAVGEGTATITATSASDDQIFVCCEVEVTAADDPDDPVGPGHDDPVPAESITLGEASLDLTVGEDVKVEVKIEPEGADQGVIWSSSDESVATVDADGNVTAVGEGTATITATSITDGSVSASIEVTVKKEGEEEGPGEGDGPVGPGADPNGPDDPDDPDDPNGPGNGDDPNEPGEGDGDGNGADEGDGNGNGADDELAGTLGETEDGSDGDSDDGTNGDDDAFIETGEGPNGNANDPRSGLASLGDVTALVLAMLVIISALAIYAHQGLRLSWSEISESISRAVGGARSRSSKDGSRDRGTRVRTYNEATRSRRSSRPVGDSGTGPGSDAWRQAVVITTRKARGRESGKRQ